MSDSPSILADALHVHGTLHPHERKSLVDHWSKLDHRLQAFDQRDVVVDLYIHDRDSAAQRVTLKASISGLATFVATDGARDLATSLNRVRDELLRQLTDAKRKAEPRSNRHLRSDDQG